MSKAQTILIVDDNPKNLQVLGSVLKDNDYKVEFATNGALALEWLDEQVFDLVLLDIMMPEMDGYQACSRIRKDKKFDDLPIIFLTAKTDKESIIQGFKAGAQDYISKPFDTNELLARVKTHLELRASKEKVKEVNQWLEKKVSERTAQLELANRQLNELDRAKTDFLNLIGHEIRTPLNGIVGPMELIRSDYKDTELDKMLNLMTESVERLEKFAFEALLITNLRTGKHNFNAEKVSIKDLYESLKVKMSSALHKSNTTLKINVPDSVFAIGDYELLLTCIESLLENALLYIKEQGTLVVDAQEEDGIVIITMIDARIVFSDSFLESMDKLFEPEGEYIDSNLGIGMALVNMILAAHNGSISMENIPGKGATLILKIAQ